MCAPNEPRTNLTCDKGTGLQKRSVPRNNLNSIMFAGINFVFLKQNYFVGILAVSSDLVNYVGTVHELCLRGFIFELFFYFYCLQFKVSRENRQINPSQTLIVFIKESTVAYKCPNFS